MTNEEKAFLVEYLVDAGDIDPDGDVEAQFMKWYQVREEPLSGEIHYKAVLEAARVRKRSFDRGYRLAAADRASETTGLPAAATPIPSLDGSRPDA